MSLNHNKRLCCYPSVRCCQCPEHRAADTRRRFLVTAMMLGAAVSDFADHMEQTFVVQPVRTGVGTQAIPCRTRERR
jgi:hypothetical protein